MEENINPYRLDKWLKRKITSEIKYFRRPLNG
jgi:hypothetical protein